ncbi:tudor and KH domain-containing protein isoform X2 [Protopterus annectens]|uniref:tudor and KH domain-containing protein isoform X2 n=1 Tax=Protopterus annectens TaxID=7888 RepID=UPI001CFB9E22|nr:tudor and KH domain-containing protein isoform X2 [Protopterus annectens]
MLPSVEDSWNNLTTLQKVALGLGIPASVTVLYILYRRYKESQEDIVTFIGQDEIEVDMKVPQDAVKLIIGRQGAVIKQLRKETGARIDLEDGDGEDMVGQRTLLICGHPVQVCKAKAMIHQILADNVQVTEKFYVPQQSVGRIIGRGGEVIRSICRQSRARVTCEKETSDQKPTLKRLITIQGNKKEVQEAKDLILEKVAEEEEFRKKIIASAATRQLRKQPAGIRKEEFKLSFPAGANLAGVSRNDNVTSLGHPKDETTQVGSMLSALSARLNETTPGRDKGTMTESLKSTLPKGLIEETNSGSAKGTRTESLENALPLGLKKGTRSESLENGLSTRLNSEANSETDNEPHEFSDDVSKFEIPSPDLSFQPDEHLEVCVSASENPNHFWIQILGSRTLHLDKLTKEMSQYYNTCDREDEVLSAQVGDIVAAPYTGEQSWYRARVLGFLENGNIDLYYVDYGDNGEFPLSTLRALRSDFLSLPFQAIECGLSEVAPVGTHWTEKSLDDFDRLTYCAQWKPLVAKICSYSQAGSSTRPSIKLYDAGSGKSIDIGEELIHLGHAVYQPHEEHRNSRDRSDLSVKEDSEKTLKNMLDDVTDASPGSFPTELLTRKPSEDMLELSDETSVSKNDDELVLLDDDSQ